VRDHGIVTQALLLAHARQNTTGGHFHKSCELGLIPVCTLAGLHLDASPGFHHS
jgi:hypothetical protein